MIPLCVDQGIGIAPWSPLAGGILTGKYKAGSPPPSASRVTANPDFITRHPEWHWEDPVNLKMLHGLEELCHELGRPMVQLVLAWFLANPAITAPVIGTSSIQQLEQSVAATELDLSKADLDRINTIVPGKGPYFT